MGNESIHQTHIRRDVAEAALGHALRTLDDVRESRDVYRELLGVALGQVATLTHRLQDSATSIRQLVARNRLLTDQVARQSPRRAA